LHVSNLALAAVLEKPGLRLWPQENEGCALNIMASKCLYYPETHEYFALRQNCVIFLLQTPKTSFKDSNIQKIKTRAGHSFKEPHKAKKQQGA
jgi:hypothetical protein